MLNSSQVSHFTLGAYFDTGPLRWLYFLIIMSVYVLIVLSNLLLIIVICLNRTLHEPMYIFLCSLCINDILGSTVLCPFILFQILQDVHIVAYFLCLLQMFCSYVYVGVNFTNLGVMSYDRYVAICFPLQYHTCMNFNKVVFLIILIWIPPFLAVLVTAILTSSLTLCGNVIQKVFCDNYCIVKLSCFDTTVNNWYDLVAAFLFVTIPVSVIFFTYLQIFKVCFKGSKQTRQKALSTCTPHLCSLLNSVIGQQYGIIQTRIELSNLPQTLTIFLSLYSLTCQPLFNTPIYGLNLSKIRNVCRDLLKKNKTPVLEME